MIEKKGFDRITAYLKLLARTPINGAHCKVWLIGPSTWLHKAQNAGTDNP